MKKHSIINGQKLSVRGLHKSVLPLSPCEVNFSFEEQAFAGLQYAIKPGDVVFDVGASYGVMTALSARLTGETGKVVSFEANQKVMDSIPPFLKDNALTHVVLVNAAVGERSGKQVDFYVIDGFKSVASSRNKIMEDLHQAYHINVKMISLDDYCQENEVYPDVIKLDIEGGEYMALQGSLNLLKDKKPAFVIESHGKEISTIGGSFVEICNLFYEHDYRIFRLDNGEEITAATADKLDEEYLHIIACPASSTDWINGLQSAITQSNQFHSESKAVWHNFYDAREVINKEGELENAISLLKTFLEISPTYPEANYLIAVTFQQADAEEEAVKYFGNTIEQGFRLKECYQSRGLMHYKAGNLQEAEHDIQAALVFFHYQASGKELSNDDTLLMVLADIYTTQEKYESALEILAEYQILFGDTLRALYLAGFNYQSLNKPNLANAAYTKLLELTINGKSAETELSESQVKKALDFVVRACLNNGAYPAAEKWLTLYTSHYPADPHINSIKAYSTFKTQSPEQALNPIKQALEKSADMPEFLFELGIAKYHEDSLAQSTIDLEMALLLNNSAENGFQEKILGVLSRVHINQGAYDKAIETLEKYPVFIKWDAELSYLAGVCYYYQKDFDRALFSFRRSEELGRDDFWLRLYHLRTMIDLDVIAGSERKLLSCYQALMLEGEAHQSKISYILLKTVQNNVKNNRFSMVVWLMDQTKDLWMSTAQENYLYALASHQTGYKGRAMKYYQIALDMGHNEFWTRYNLGNLLVQMRRYEDAKAELVRAEELNPEHAGVQMLLENMEEYNQD